MSVWSITVTHSCFESKSLQFRNFQTTSHLICSRSGLPASLLILTYESYSRCGVHFFLHANCSLVPPLQSVCARTGPSWPGLYPREIVPGSSLRCTRNKTPYTRWATHCQDWDTGHLAAPRDQYKTAPWRCRQRGEGGGYKGKFDESGLRCIQCYISKEASYIGARFTVPYFYCRSLLPEKASHPDRCIPDLPS